MTTTVISSNGFDFRLWLIPGRGVLSFVTPIRDFALGLVVRSGLPQQHRQLGDVARYASGLVLCEDPGDVGGVFCLPRRLDL